jgi:hypothetical protein
MLDNGWWVAGLEYNDQRRPEGLSVYKLGGNSWRGHIQDVCNNGLKEAYETVKNLAKKSPGFFFVSEALA